MQANRSATPFEAFMNGGGHEPINAPSDNTPHADNIIDVAGAIVKAFIKYCNYTDAIHAGVELTAAEQAQYQAAERRLANPYAALAVNAAGVLLYARHEDELLIERRQRMRDANVAAGRYAAVALRECSACGRHIETDSGHAWDDCSPEFNDLSPARQREYREAMRRARFAVTSR